MNTAPQLFVAPELHGQTFTPTREPGESDADYRSRCEMANAIMSLKKRLPPVNLGRVLYVAVDPQLNARFETIALSSDDVIEKVEKPKPWKAMVKDGWRIDTVQLVPWHPAP